MACPESQGVCSPVQDSATAVACWSPPEAGAPAGLCSRRVPQAGRLAEPSTALLPLERARLANATCAPAARRSSSRAWCICAPQCWRANGSVTGLCWSLARSSCASRALGEPEPAAVDSAPLCWQPARRKHSAPQGLGWPSNTLSAMQRCAAQRQPVSSQAAAQPGALASRQP